MNNHFFFIYCGFNLPFSSPDQINKGEKQLSQNLSGRSADAMKIDRRVVKVDIPDIISVSPCADLTLPPGAGLCIDTTHGPIFLVSMAFLHFAHKGLKRLKTKIEM